MIQFDDDIRKRISELLIEAIGGLEDMFPIGGDERISDPITFALTLGEAIGARKACKAFGCEKDELLKDDMTCSFISIAKGKGILKSAVHITDVCKYKLLTLMMDSISDLVDIYFERKDWTYSVKYDPSDAINMSDSLSKIAKANTLLEVSEIVFDGIHDDEEVDSHIRALRDIIDSSMEIQKRIIDDFKIYLKKENRGRTKADTTLSLLDVLNGNKTLYDKIVSLNTEKRIRGARVGYLYVALTEEKVVSSDCCMKTFYNAIEKEFGSIGDYHNINKVVRNNTNEKTLSNYAKLKISDIKKNLF